jgi:hypothetical protein
MRQLPRWLKLIGIASLIAEAGAAMAVLWHAGPRAR